MEGYAFAYSLDKASKDFYVYKIVSDTAGKNSSQLEIDFKTISKECLSCFKTIASKHF